MIARNPCLTFGVTGLIFYGVEVALSLSYDESGWRGLLYWISQLFQLPFWAVLELQATLNIEFAEPVNTIAVGVLGLVICVTFDALLRVIVRFFGK